MDEFKEAVSKYGRIDKRFLVFLENVEKFQDIETGVVFILAVWSAPALVQFSRLTEHLSGLNLGDLKIYVMDTDILTNDDLKRKLFPVPHGWGETFWIKNRKIEHFMNSKEHDASKIVLYTSELLAEKLAD